LANTTDLAVQSSDTIVSYTSDAHFYQVCKRTKYHCRECNKSCILYSCPPGTNVSVI